MTPDDVSLELQNWALWRLSGGWFDCNLSATISPAYSPEGRLREAKVPIRAGAAGDVDEIVRALPDKPRHALEAYYLYINPQGRRIPSHYLARQVAQELGIGERTYREHLTQGRAKVGEALAWKRRQTELTREQYA